MLTGQSSGVLLHQGTVPSTRPTVLLVLSSSRRSLLLGKRLCIRVWRAAEMEESGYLIPLGTQEILSGSPDVGYGTAVVGLCAPRF